MTSKSHSPRHHQDNTLLPFQAASLQLNSGPSQQEPHHTQRQSLLCGGKQVILNVLLQRPEVIKKEIQLYHKTKELKDLGTPELCH